jgi:hypothetical protein
MTKNSLLLKHHLVGIGFALTIIGSVYLAWPQQKIENLAALENPNVYIAFGSDNLLGLARVGAAKAMNRHSIVKFGYDTEISCALSNLNPAIGTIKVQEVLNAGLGSKWIGTEIAAGENIVLSEFCQMDKKGSFLSSSSVLREATYDGGRMPSFVALGTFDSNVQR